MISITLKPAVGLGPRHRRPVASEVDKSIGKWAGPIRNMEVRSVERGVGVLFLIIIKAQRFPVLCYHYYSSRSRHSSSKRDMLVFSCGLARNKAFR